MEVGAVGQIARQPEHVRRGGEELRHGGDPPAAEGHPGGERHDGRPCDAEIDQLVGRHATGVVRSSGQNLAGREGNQVAGGRADVDQQSGLSAHCGGRGRPGREAVEDVYLGLLSLFPDSHVVRKFGAEVAETLRREAAAFAESLDFRDDRERALDAFDLHLKAKGLNPGTTADLTVAALFTARLEAPPPEPRG
ncbi:triphosphoribosyl-dephospho-CoA synthase [Hansschlegelia beijingensis]